MVSVAARRLVSLHVLLWLVVAGCARVFLPPAPEVTVRTLEVDFPSRERGLLRFSLAPVQPPPIEVRWELFVDGSPFASGVQAVDRPAGPIEVQVPLVIRHLSFREGESAVDVRLQGQVVAAPGAPGLRFELRRSIDVHGRPTPGLPIE